MKENNYNYYGCDDGCRASVKVLLERMGIGVKCYLGDERGGIGKEKESRTQAGYTYGNGGTSGSTYVFGNALDSIDGTV